MDEDSSSRLSALGIRVFVSFSSHDLGQMRRIVDALEEDGVATWIAPRDIQPGRNFPAEIVEGIESCCAVLLILSESANESVYVKNEVERAVSKGKAVFTVRIADVRPCKALELLVSASQWVDLFRDDAESQFNRLVYALRTLAEGQTTRRGTADDQPIPKGEEECEPAEGVSIGDMAALRAELPMEQLQPAVLHRRFAAAPERQIKTGCSVLNTVIDRETGKSYLLKKVPKQHLRGPIASFAHLSIDGSNIAAPILQCEDAEFYYELLPKIDGWTFSEIISLNRGVFGEYLTWWCMALLEIVRTLQAHRPPLVHRDIRPANVMVCRHDLSHLILVDCTTMVPCPAQDGTVPFGTRNYSPPEAVSGHVTLAYDLYSVGCTVFALNHCEDPPSPVEIAHFGKTMDLIMAEFAVSEVFPKLVALDPKERFPNAASALFATIPVKSTSASDVFLEAKIDSESAYLCLPDGRRLVQGVWGSRRSS